MLNKALSTLAHYLAPPYCIQCKEFLENREPLCSQCYAQINPIVSTELSITPTQSIRVYALSDYENPLKKLILAKNYGNRVAAKYLATLMIKTLPFQMIECDYLIPIPLHWTRLLRRGFNQTEIMAQTISTFIKKPVLNGLCRSKRTKFQSTLTAEERAGNVHDAFTLMPNLPEIAGKNLILIDDLMTTGATLRSTTKLFLKCKPKSITAIVACRKL